MRSPKPSASLAAGASRKSGFIPDSLKPPTAPAGIIFWVSKMGSMGHRGVSVFSRKLRYRNRSVRLPDGSEHTFLVGEEKGIDVRIALDVIRMAHRKEFDVAVVFSQDQDLSEVADEIRVISTEQVRWIKMASAFPRSPTSHNKRGINSTDWVPIDRAMYDRCIDPRDFRPTPTTP
jgi:hypothetical protein